jgi:hypothetical protein
MDEFQFFRLQNKEKYFDYKENHYQRGSKKIILLWDNTKNICLHFRKGYGDLNDRKFLP